MQSVRGAAGRDDVQWLLQLRKGLPLRRDHLHRQRIQRPVAQVNPAVCQGCGACTVACMSGAMDLKGFSNRQIIAEVDAICR